MHFAARLQMADFCIATFTNTCLKLMGRIDQKDQLPLYFPPALFLLISHLMGDVEQYKYVHKDMPAYQSHFLLAVHPVASFL
jgi:hypothetical protein